EASVEIEQKTFLCYLIHPASSVRRINGIRTFHSYGEGARGHSAPFPRYLTNITQAAASVKYFCLTSSSWLLTIFFLTSSSLSGTAAAPASDDEPLYFLT
ncbi:hypothetical protein, partial [Hornefia butyriciproducens]|uniref:hypothetical protein n=1 Tax=Hornefia butyriciproducens TaxID=2652293 RepID=UPI0023F045D3